MSLSPPDAPSGNMAKLLSFFYSNQLFRLMNLDEEYTCAEPEGKDYCCQWDENDWTYWLKEGLETYSLCITLKMIVGFQIDPPVITH